MTSNDNRWRKASYSGGEGGNCVEIGEDANSVLVRDTKQAGTGPVLKFSADAWRKLVARVKD